MQQTLSIPQHRDPVARAALIGSALALVWLGATGAMPPITAGEQSPPAQSVLIVATPTLPLSLPTPAPAVPILAVATAGSVAPPAPVVVDIPAKEAPTSQLVTNPDGSISLPGSEAWLSSQTNAAPASDATALAIERAAQAAYQTLPTAAAPSESNTQPVRKRRNYTGR